MDISTRGPPGLLAATAATDGIVRLWDATRGGAPVRLLAGHSWYATAVAFRPGSSELASASMDKTIRLWRYEEEESVGAPSPSLHDESTAASSAPLQLLDDDDDDAEGSTETPLAPAPNVLLRLDAAPKALAWTRDGSLLLAGGDAPAPIRFDCRGGTPIRLAELPGAGHRGAVVQIAVAASFAGSPGLPFKDWLPLEMDTVACRTGGAQDSQRSPMDPRIAQKCPKAA